MKLITTLVAALFLFGSAFTVRAQSGGLGATDVSGATKPNAPSKKQAPASSPAPSPKAPSPDSPKIEDLLPTEATPSTPAPAPAPAAPAPTPAPAVAPAPTVTAPANGDDPKPSVVGPAPQRIIKKKTSQAVAPAPVVTPVPVPAPAPASAPVAVPMTAVASPGPRSDPAAVPLVVAVNGASVEDQAVDILLKAAMGPFPEMRCNAVEAMQAMPDRALPMTQRALSDQNPAVRFAAVVTAGVLKFKLLVPAIRPLLTDSNESVKAAAIYASWSLGEKVDLTPLAEMLRGPDPRLRGNVAMLLGLLGDKSAVPLLKSTARVPMPRVSAGDDAVSRIQTSEAIAKLGDDAALDALRAGMYSQYDEVRVLAINALGTIGDQRMQVAIDRFLEEPPVELQLAASGSLMRLGNPKGLAFTMQTAGHADPIVRMQAAWTLGWFNDDAASGVLQFLMKDPQQRVQVAAAGAILRRAGRGIRHQIVELKALPVAPPPVRPQSRPIKAPAALPKSEQ